MPILNLSSLERVNCLINNGTIETREISRFRKNEEGRYSYRDQYGNVYTNYILAKNIPALEFFIKIKLANPKAITMVASMFDTMKGILDTDKYATIRNYILRLIKLNRCYYELDELVKRPIIFIKINWGLVKNTNTMECKELSDAGDFSVLMDQKKFTIFEYHSILKNTYIRTSYNMYAPTFEYISDIIKQIIDDPIKRDKEINEIIDYIVDRDREQAILTTGEYDDE